LILATVATGTCLTIGPIAAEDDRPGSDERPKAADLLVFAEGDHQGDVIKPSDLAPGGPPVHAWAKDPKTSVIRDGSRLNEILLVKLDAGELDEDTQPLAADGILAYSAICTHAGCSVTEWVKATEGGGNVFKCPCHNSEFDPRRGARVVFGPAPRRLAVLPLAISGGALVVSRPFIGKVGVPQAG
jgi:Rieske Fe-S protein